MPEKVSMILWDSQPGRKRCPKSAAEITADDCNPERYLSTMSALLEGSSSRGRLLKWILPEELFPTNFEGTGDSRRAKAIIPEWIRQCWMHLPGKSIPQQVMCGFGSVRENLRDWESFCRTGTGFLFEVDGKSLFFGYDSGEIHTRVSRATMNSDSGPGLSNDWIRQTKLLFRNRTGGSLHRILLPEAVEWENGMDIESVDLITEKPPAWISCSRTGLEVALLFLHACALVGKETVSQRSIEFLERKRNQELWGHRFRGACALLALAWLCSTAGACRHEPDEPATLSGKQLEWEGQHRLWKTKNRQWEAQQSVIKSRTGPFQVIGALARSVPRDMMLDRVHLQKADTAGGKTYSLDLGGRCSGEDPSSTFREWLEEAKKSASLSEIENLRFSRDHEVLVFSLHAKMTGG